MSWRSARRHSNRQLAKESAAGGLIDVLLGRVSLDNDTVCTYSINMEAPSKEELESLRFAGRTYQADSVVHWQSAFGLIIIEVRHGQVFVNGEPVQPAKPVERDCT